MGWRRVLWDRGWLKGLLLIVAVVFAYQPVWHAGFIWDDDAHLTANPCIVGPLGFKEIWMSSAATYYPLVLTSFWVQHAIWGLNPLPYHLVNVAMHAACTVLLWLVLRCMKVRGAWFGAALWGLHPVQTESVAWITELKNTQSCLFYLLAIRFFLKWRAAGTFAGRKGTEWDYAFALLCAVLAILSKASTVMLPVVLGLVWWWSDGRWCWRNLFRLAPFFIISAAASGWTIWEQQFHSGAVGTEWSQSLAERLVIAGKAVWFYLGKLLWPHPLIFIYPRWRIDALCPTAYLPVLALGIILILLWVNRGGRTGPVFFAFVYFVVSLFPVLDFFNVYFFRYSFVGDHFQYLASLGPVALAAAGITVALGRFEKKSPYLKPALCGTLLLVLGLLTWRQCGMYADMETLWRVTINKNPDCSMAHNNLGTVLASKGQVDEAIVQFRKALEIQQDNADAHDNLGNVLLQKGSVDEAIIHYQKALEIKPDSADACCALGNALSQRGRLDEAMEQFQKAIHLQPDLDRAYYNLGNLLLQKGRVDEAIIQCQKALEIKPGCAEAHYSLGNALLQERRVDEAIQQYQSALETKPDYAEAHINLGNALLQKKRVDEAVEQFQQAINIQPASAQAHYDLSQIFLSKGRVDEAIAHLEKALEIRPDYAKAHASLGVVLFQKKQVDEAIVHFQKVLEIRPDYPKACYNLARVAWLLATSPEASVRNGDKAVALAEQAVRLPGGEDPMIIRVLAAAYAETGRFAEAIDTAQRAKQLAAQQGNTALADVLDMHIKLYQAGKPFRDKNTPVTPTPPAPP